MGIRKKIKKLMEWKLEEFYRFAKKDRENDKNISYIG